VRSLGDRADASTTGWVNRLKLAFRWSWVVTLPVAGFFAVWLLNVFAHYENFGLRYETISNAAKLDKIGRMEFQRLVRKVQLSMMPTPRSQTAGVPAIHLFVAEASKKSLEEHLPQSGREYVEAHLMHPDGAIRKASIKYRGDFHWHWAFPKKSMRVKTKKSKLYRGMRQINFIAPKWPEQLNNYLSYRLAHRMEILAPRAEMVEVFVNGRNTGVHLMVEQLEEMVLRHNDRMPGDLYVGELIARDRYNGIDNHVFHHPRLWEKAAVNNHYPEESRAPIEKLCDLVVALRSEATVGELRALLDLDAWGRFAAFRVLTASPHYDHTHNWRLYYDPWRHVIEPIVWDTNGWHPNLRTGGEQEVNPDIVTSLLDEVLEDPERNEPEYLLARARELAEAHEG